jgi:flagellar hook-associated protein 1
MSSLGSILNVARSAMQASQVALQTTSQNIANAGVEGYTVQRVQFAAHTPERFSYGSLGTGVDVQSITQSRDRLLDAQYRSASGSSAHESRTNDMLTRVERVFGEPSSTGLANSIDAFWNSWSDLASDPTSNTARGVVRQRGSEVSGLLNGFASQLDTVASDSRTLLASDVNRLNVLTKQIAGMTPAIVGAEAGGHTANDLRDQRNRLLDEVSKLIDTQVIERKDGSVGVYLGGRTVVDGTSYHQLATSGGQPLAVTFAGETDALQEIGGSIGASITAVNVTLPGVMADLDTLAGTLVRTTNAIHKTGTVYSGNPPVPAAAGNFFGQDPVIVGSGDPLQTARGIKLDASLSNLAAIAASGPAANGPGDNTLANQLAGLRTLPLSFGTSAGGTFTGTIDGFYRYTVSGVAMSANLSSNQAAAQETLVEQADTRRQSVSGVATDEELVNMIKQQQAYQAAARLITVVSEMSDTLINLGR